MHRTRPPTPRPYRDSGHAVVAAAVAVAAVVAVVVGRGGGARGVLGKRQDLPRCWEEKTVP